MLGWTPFSRVLSSNRSLKEVRQIPGTMGAVAKALRQEHAPCAGKQEMWDRRGLRESRVKEVRGHGRGVRKELGHMRVLGLQGRTLTSESGGRQGSV